MKNNRGAATIETVAALTAIAGLAYWMVSFTLYFISSHQMFSRLDGRVREALTNARTPCIETVRVDNTEGYKKIRKKIEFVREAICN